MWIKRNPNPKHKQVGDCVVRAIAIATNRPWRAVYNAICLVGCEECDMPSSDHVWGKYLHELGFEPFLLPAACPDCVTVRAFCRMYPTGVYIIGTGSHAVCVMDGDYYDSWDSGDQQPSFFWRVK